MYEEHKIPQMLLKAEEAAQVLGISRALFYALVSEGKIRKVKIRQGRSGAVRFRPADLEAFVKNHIR